MDRDTEAFKSLIRALNQIPDSLLKYGRIEDNEPPTDDDQDDEECLDCCLCGTCDCGTEYCD